MTSADIGYRATTRRPAILSLLLSALAIVSAMALPVMAVLLDSYDYMHGWVSAHFATIARSYMEHGVAALGGVPIQNNPPLTAMPDAYLNWPPLYPLLLSAVFSIFGETETVHHLFAASINITLGAIIAMVIHRQFGLAAAAIAAIAFFNAPILVQYGHAGSQLHLALAFCVLSLWLFGLALCDSGLGRIAWPAALAGCAAFSLAALSSWEPVLAAPGLAVAALVMRDRRGFTLAVAYGVTAFVTVVAVFGLYWMQYHYFGDAILQRIMLRAGFDVPYDPAVSAMFSSPHFILESHEPHRPLGLGYLAEVTVIAAMAQGTLGLAGLVFLYRAPIWRRGGNAIAYAVTGLAAVYVLWVTLMSQHVAGHRYELLLLAPLGGLAAGAVAGAFAGYWLGRGTISAMRQFMLVVAIALVAVGGRVSTTMGLLQNHDPSASAEIRFAKLIREVVVPGSIVAHAGPSMVPVYYSQRHIVRSVWDEATLAKHRADIERLCADCPVYMAIPDAYRQRFAGFIAANKAESDSELGVIVRLR